VNILQKILSFFKSNSPADKPPIGEQPQEDTAEPTTIGVVEEEPVEEAELTEEEQQALQIKNFVRSDDISNHQLAAMFMQSLTIEWEEELYQLIGQSAEKLTFWAQQDFKAVKRYFTKIEIGPRFFGQYSEVAAFAEALPLLTEVEELHWNAGPYWNQHPILSAAAQLPKLKRLYAQGCKMHYIPDELCESAVLEELYLGNNKLHELPESVEGLYNLRVLDLSNNKFQRCSRNIPKLKKLEVLKLQENPLSHIEPRFLGRLYRLRDLQLSEDVAHFYYDTLKAWLPDVDFDKPYWKFDE